MRLFGTSGIRALADSSLLGIALSVGLSLGKRYRRVIVGSDTRTSSPSIKSALLGGLMAAGARPSDAGILPTPTLAVAAKNYDCAVMVTASHNPPEYNGLKMLNPDGSPFGLDQQHQVEDCIGSNTVSTVSWEYFQPLEYDRTAVRDHIAHIRRRFKSHYPLNVVVDCGGGAATSITPEMLETIGCRVHVINGIQTGFFPRPSEPVENNLDNLKRAVVEFGADLGLAHDGDADRVMAVDDRGRFVCGDTLLSIFAREIGATKIITTIDSSMTVDNLGVQVIRTGVGDNNVSEALRAEGDFGGEPSGAWIFPESSFCPDGIYAAAMLVEIVSRRKLSDLVDASEHYPIRRVSVKCSINLERFETVMSAKLDPISIQRIDGLKFNLEDGWILVRRSGTEPITRMTVEAKTELRMDALFKQAEILMLESTGS